MITKSKLAHFISEVFAPWIVNAAFFLILGAASSAWASGIAAAVGTGLAPMVVIMALMKQGYVGNHHVTDRSQRGLVLLGIAVCVAILVGVLAFLDAPRLIWVGVISALIFLAIFAVITVVGQIKASIHVGLWVCVTTYLGLTVAPEWFGLLGLAPVIAWSRIVIKHHSLVEVGVGVLGGGVVTGICYWLFLL